MAKYMFILYNEDGKFVQKYNGFDWYKGHDKVDAILELGGTALIEKYVEEEAEEDATN